MILTSFLIPTYAQMLGTLSSWLDKAETQLPAGQAERLLAARLAPDMFPLATQIRFACRQAQEGIYRMQGKDFTASMDTLLNEGRNAGERPGTLAQARAHIAETLTVVESASASDGEIDPASPIDHALPNGMILDVTAERYARDWALPQFYFHLITAYAILRSQGIDLGKADYVQHLLPHLRHAATA